MLSSSTFADRRVQAASSASIMEAMSVFEGNRK